MEQKMIVFSNEQKFADVLNKPVTLIGSLSTSKESLASITDADVINLSAILVSAGCNKNDDYFTAEEMWENRNSAIDKPFNIEHDVRKVIGHFTDVFMIDDNHEVMSQLTATPELHLGVQISIYRQLTPRDVEWKEKVDELIERMWEGDIFVSSEVVFPTFDYGLLDDSGLLVETIERNETTSFLTANLRLFGGTGRYRGYRLCRILRGINIVGGGLVEKPANPNSVFLTMYNEKDNSMSDIEKLQEENAKLRVDLASMHTQLKTNDIVKLQDSISTLETELQASKAELQTKVEESEKVIEAKTKEIEALNSAQEVAKEKIDSVSKEREELKAKLAEAAEKLSEIEADNRREKRVSALVEKSVERAEAEELVVKFENLSDDQFVAICDIVAKASINKGSEEEEVNSDSVADALEDSTANEETINDVDNSANELQESRSALQFLIASKLEKK